MTPLRRLATALLVALTLATLALPNAHAATITWGAPQTISGDSDINTTGTLAYALSMGTPSVPQTTVNGVTFAPFGIGSGFPQTVTVGNVTLTESPGNLLAYNTFGTATAPFSGLSNGYQSLVGTGAYSNLVSTITVTLAGLTSGQDYLVQWWTNNSALLTPVDGGQFTNTIAGPSAAVSLDPNTTDAVGGVGQFAVGTFTADATSQVFTLDGTNAGYVPLINGLQVRAVPEPATYAMALAGVAYGGFSMWRRRKRIRHGGAMLLIVAVACLAVGGSAVQAATVTWFGPSQAANSNATWTAGSTSAQNYGVAFVSGTATAYSMDWLQIGLNTSSVITGSGSIVVDLTNTTNLNPYSAVPGTTVHASDTINFTCPPTTATAFTVNLAPADFPNISNFSMTGTTGYSLRLWGPSGAFGIMRTTGYANGTTNNFYSVSDGYVALDTFRNSIANYTNTANSYPTLSIAFGTTVVPEPSTYAMAFAGLACGGLACGGSSMWQRRKRA